MTQDEIIEMAKQVGFWKEHTNTWMCNSQDIEAFAKLVAQHTLANIDPSKFISFQEGVEAGRLAEREACAKFIEHDYVRQFERPWRDDLSAAIRARGQA